VDSESDASPKSDTEDGVFGPPVPFPGREVLRFGLMINVVCVVAATSIRRRSAA
jgi:hypothetical protein